jgi:hypothetical protein
MAGHPLSILSAAQVSNLAAATVMAIATADERAGIGPVTCLPGPLSGFTDVRSAIVRPMTMSTSRDGSRTVPRRGGGVLT